MKSNPNTPPLRTVPPVSSIATERFALKAKEVAELIGVSIATIRRAVKSGQLRPIRHFRHLLFTRAEVERYLEAGMLRRAETAK